MKKFAVIGDILIDEYNYGNITRISPEAPIPVFLSEEDNPICLPGGASNVAYQFKNLPSMVFLLGPIDNRSKTVLQEFNFNIQLCPIMSGNNPRKIRFYQDNTPIIRRDIEKKNYGIQADELLKIQSQIKINLTSLNPDVVILSDYAKGLFSIEFCNSIIDYCNSKGIITIVDPKHPPLNKWKGCSIIKPNLKEAKALTGKEEIHDIIEFLKKECDNVIVTDAGNKVHCYNGNYNCIESIYTVDDVNSVVGAGDAFMAVLAYLYASGMNLKESCEIAFKAGMEYVKDKHNNPVYLEKVLNPSKIKTKEEILIIKKNKTVFTNGCFDILNSNHISTLKFAKSKGNVLVVGVNSDSSIKRLKGDKRPINNLKERMQVLSELSCVDYVVAFEEDTPLELIKFIKPDLIVKGGDYKKEDIAGFGICDIELAPVMNAKSTTEVISSISQG